MTNAPHRTLDTNEDARLADGTARLSRTPLAIAGALALVLLLVPIETVPLWIYAMASAFSLHSQTPSIESSVWISVLLAIGWCFFSAAIYLRKTRPRRSMLIPALFGLAPVVIALTTKAALWTTPSHARSDAFWFELSPLFVPAVAALGQLLEWRGRSGGVFYVTATVIAAVPVLAFFAMV